MKIRSFQFTLTQKENNKNVNKVEAHTSGLVNTARYPNGQLRPL